MFTMIFHSLSTWKLEKKCCPCWKKYMGNLCPNLQTHLLINLCPQQSKISRKRKKKNLKIRNLTDLIGQEDPIRPPLQHIMIHWMMNFLIQSSPRQTETMDQIILSSPTGLSHPNTVTIPIVPRLPGLPRNPNWMKMVMMEVILFIQVLVLPLSEV